MAVYVSLFPLHPEKAAEFHTMFSSLNSRRALASQTTGLVHSSSMDMSGINRHTHGGAPSDAPYTRRSSVVSLFWSRYYQARES